MHDAAPILPGATIGILGGGQLGRMTAMAARSMGYDVHVLDPDPDCSARPLASRRDHRALRRRRRGRRPRARLRGRDARDRADRAGRDGGGRRATRRCVPARARSGSSRTACGRRSGSPSTRSPSGAFRRAESAEDVADAVAALGACIVKAAHGGYDGRGQARVRDAAQGAARVGGGRRAAQRRRAAAGPRARSSRCSSRGAPDGQMAVYPPAHQPSRGAACSPGRVLPARLDPGGRHARAPRSRSASPRGWTSRGCSPSSSSSRRTDACS